MERALPLPARKARRTGARSWAEAGAREVSPHGVLVWSRPWPETGEVVDVRGESRAVRWSVGPLSRDTKKQVNWRVTSRPDRVDRDKVETGVIRLVGLVWLLLGLGLIVLGAAGIGGVAAIVFGVVGIGLGARQLIKADRL